MVCNDIWLQQIPLRESWSLCEVCRWGMRFWIALIWHKTPPMPFLVITWIKLPFELMADNFLAVNHQPFTSVTRFRSQARPCETWSGQIDTGIGLSPSTSFSPTLHYVSIDKEIKWHAFPSWLFPLKQLIFELKTEPSHTAFFVSSLLWRQLSLISCCYLSRGRSNDVVRAQEKAKESDMRWGNWACRWY